MMIPPAPRVAKPYQPQLSYLSAHLFREDSTHPDVHEVPIRRVPIVRTVLAHRRLKGKVGVVLVIIA